MIENAKVATTIFCHNVFESLRIMNDPLEENDGVP